MLRALYSSATGMKAQEYLIDVTANNLANVNTNGFKRSQLDFADLLYSHLRQAGSETLQGQNSPIGLEIGSGVRPVGTTKSFLPGTVEQTGNPTDVAIEGEGFFKVIGPGDQEFYTRDGAFRIDGQSGQLVTADGYRMANPVTIPNDATAISIGPDGGVSATQQGVVNRVGQLDLFKFANPAGLSSEGNNLFARTSASGDEIAGLPGTDGFGIMRGGFLERSNVEVVTELISLITAQRAYEINSRAIRAGDEMLSTTTDIVR